MKQLFFFSLLFVSIQATAQFSVKIGVHFDPNLFKVDAPIDITGFDATPVFVRQQRTYHVNLIGMSVLPEFNVPFNDENGVSISGGIKINFVSSKDNDFLTDYVTFDFPAYIMLRHGRGAGKSSDKNIGFALGGGYHYHRQLIPYGTGSIVGEIIFKDNGIRIHYDPVPYKMYAIYTSQPGVSDVGSFQQFGATFFYIFPKR